MAAASVRWLLIPVVVLHNLEEGLTFPPFLDRIQAFVGSLAPDVSLPELETLQLALCLATVVPCGIAIWANLKPHSRGMSWVAAVLSAIFFANAFLPHIPAAIGLGGYSPGLLTAVFLAVPYHLWLSSHFLKTKILSRRAVAAATGLGFVLVLPCIVSLIAISRSVVG